MHIWLLSCAETLKYYRVKKKLTLTLKIKFSEIVFLNMQMRLHLI